ncbi:MAG: DinB family protein [Nakamurella sp.]
MPSPAPLTPDEIPGLLGFLEMQRGGVRNAVRGLTDDQTRLTPIPSTTLSLGGLLKHLVIVEISWLHADILQEPEEPETPAQRAAAFTLLQDESVQQWLGAWGEQAEHTESTIHELGLDHPVPGYPAGSPDWNVRWVLLHLIEETARHAGHADLLREAIDGKSERQLRVEF